MLNFFRNLFKSNWTEWEEYGVIDHKNRSTKALVGQTQVFRRQNIKTKLYQYKETLMWGKDYKNVW